MNTLYLKNFCCNRYVWLSFLALIFSTSVTLAQYHLSDKPNALQIEQSKRGYGMFIHFGINTFNEIEWSDGKLPVESYHPTQLDCDQWVRVAKEAGFRYIILITKHHDGFCLWNSKYTTYDVGSSPVKTDVVEQVAKACKKYGLQLGLYYSLWDRHEPSYNDSDPHKYVGFMKNQLGELLTKYGKIIEIWFDGGWAKKDQDWMIPEVYAYIKKLQPSCLVTVNHTIRVPGTVSGIRQPMDFKEGDPIRFFPVDFRTKDPNIARWDDPKLYDYNGKKYYLIFEHTICLSDRWNWFQKKAMVPPRSIDELEELFYWCTAHNNILIVNVPPDQTGKIRQLDANRIIALADRLGIRGGAAKLPTGPVNLTFKQHIEASSAAKGHPATMANDYSLETAWIADSTHASLTLDFKTPVRFNRISLFEYYRMKQLGDGFSNLRMYGAEAYRIDAFSNNAWTTIGVGDHIGACKILHFPSIIAASKIRIVIEKANAPTGFFHIGVSTDRKKSI